MYMLGKIRWSGIPISLGIFLKFKDFKFIVTHTAKGFDVVNKAEVDIFLDTGCI